MRANEFILKEDILNEADWNKVKSAILGGVLSLSALGAPNLQAKDIASMSGEEIKQYVIQNSQVKNKQEIVNIINMLDQDKNREQPPTAQSTKNVTGVEVNPISPTTTPVDQNDLKINRDQIRKDLNTTSRSQIELGGHVHPWGGYTLPDGRRINIGPGGNYNSTTNKIGKPMGWMDDEEYKSLIKQLYPDLSQNWYDDNFKRVKQWQADVLEKQKANRYLYEPDLTSDQITPADGGARARAIAAQRAGNEYALQDLIKQKEKENQTKSNSTEINNVQKQLIQQFGNIDTITSISNRPAGGKEANTAKGHKYMIYTPEMFTDEMKVNALKSGIRVPTKQGETLLMKIK